MTPMSVNGAIICGPQPSYTDLTPVTSGCLPTGCCPSEGVWSTWSSPSACNDTCGSCGVITRTRTCMTTANGCPCTGDSTMHTPCATQPCTYPRMSCCGTYKAMAVSGRHICGPLPAITTDAPPGPLTCSASACAPGGTWSAWSASACNDTCGMCGSMIQTRTCTSAPACPCTGSTQQIGAACANLPCKFPRSTCCAGYTRATGQFVCQPSTSSKKRDIESEDDNVTYETDELEQQPSTSSYFSDTLNNILAYVALREVIHYLINDVLGIVFHAFTKLFFNASIDWWGFEHASTSKMLQIE
uniref:Uncharacterized protein n=1 Tax=Acrobeloides nanus TaxID=290746 RepID=A0A914EFH6_9BILA